MSDEQVMKMMYELLPNEIIEYEIFKWVKLLRQERLKYLHKDLKNSFENVFHPNSEKREEYGLDLPDVKYHVVPLRKNNMNISAFYSTLKYSPGIVIIQNFHKQKTKTIKLKSNAYVNYTFQNEERTLYWRK